MNDKETIMADKLSTGAQIQIGWLKGNFPQPKWESSRRTGIEKVGESWNEQWEQKEKQKVIQKIEEYKDHILQVNKDEFYAFKAQLEKRNRPFPEQFGIHLIAIGSLAVLGFEDLLQDKQTMDEGFIQDIITLVERGDCREAGAFALLGLELAERQGRFIPLILEVFDESHSLRLARHLGKISWDQRVVESLVKATAAKFLTIEMEGLSLKSYDGVGLLSALSLLELKDEYGLKGMVNNLLRLEDTQLPDQLLIFAGDAAVPGLIAGLNQEDGYNSRSRAAACLGEIGNKDAVFALLDVLKEDSVIDVIAAAKALGKLGSPAAIPGLLQILGHNSLLVRPAGSSALKKLKDLWTPEPFLAVLAVKDERIVLFAIDAIGEMKSKEAIEPLTRLAASDNKKIKKAAEKVLKKIT
jgi:hypothetical protein